MRAALDYVAAARVAGAGPGRILFRHVLPNVASPLVVQATLHLAGAILAESALSFLGLGVPPPAPSWGAMLAAGRTHVLDAPHVVIVPALAILVVVLATNVLGDELVDRLDPARRAEPATWRGRSGRAWVGWPRSGSYSCRSCRS